MTGAAGVLRANGRLALVLCAAVFVCKMAWALDTPLIVVWLPAGIGIAALRRWGPGLWPAVALSGAMMPTIAGRPVSFVAAAAAANTVMALCGAWLLGRKGAPLPDRLPGIALLVGTALLAPIPAALIGAAGLGGVPGLPDPRFPYLFAVWYGSDVLGILLASPPVLLWSGAPSWKRALARRWTVPYLAGLLLAVALFSVAGGSTARWGATYFPLVLLASGTAALFLPVEVAFTGAFVASIGSLASFAATMPGSREGLGLFVSLAANTAIVSVATLAIGAVAAERREREGALARSEDRYRRLVQAVPVGVLLHDGERVLFANPEADRALLASQERTLVGRPVKRLFAAGPSRPPDAGLPEPGRPARTSANGRLRLARSDGRVVEAECTTEDLPGGGEGEPLVLLAFRDVGDRVALEAEKRRFAERTKQAERLESLGLLSGGIAHDFNNLLTGILGNTALVRAGLTPGDMACEALETIQLAGLRAAELTAQLLAFSGRHDRSPVPVAVAPEVEETIRLLRPGFSPGVELRIEASPGTPAVQADPPQFRAILVNLVKNAAEAIGSGPGVITVRIREVLSVEREMESPYLEEAPPSGSYVRIEVADTGSGMGREEASRMFDPFFSTKRPGRGLGLASVLGIVKAHGGTVQVESEIGKGTTVRLFLPPSPGGDAAPVRKTPTDALRLLPLRGRVLVADGDSVVVETICRTLRRLGLEPSSASRAAEAQSILAEAGSSIWVAFVEETLLDESGRKLHRRLRAEWPALPVVLLAEKSGPRPAMQASPLGTGAILLKPFQAADVREALLLAAGGERKPAGARGPKA